MPTLVKQIVDQARDHHPSFDPLHLPDPMVRRALARYQSRLASKIVALNEDALAVRTVYSKTALDAAVSAGLGLALPPNVLVLDAETAPVDGGPVESVYLTTYRTFAEGALTLFPAAWIEKQTIYPIDQRKAWSIKGDTHGWETWNGMTVRLVPAMPTILSPNDPVSLPETCDDALVTNLALWMAGQRKAADALAWLRDEAKDAEQQAIQTLGSQDMTSHWTVTS